MKAAISMNFENGSNQLLHLAEQAIGSEKIASYNDLATVIDAIKTADVTAVSLVYIIKSLVLGNYKCIKKGRDVSVIFKR